MIRTKGDEVKCAYLSHAGCLVSSRADAPDIESSQVLHQDAFSSEASSVAGSNWTFRGVTKNAMAVPASLQRIDEDVPKSVLLPLVASGTPRGARIADGFASS